jgi:hypothetical protein
LFGGYLPYGGIIVSYTPNLYTLFKHTMKYYNTSNFIISDSFPAASYHISKSIL